MQNKNKFLKVAAVIAAVCVAGNTADYVENRKLLSKGDSVVSAYPAIVEVYALGGGGGGEGGHRKNYCGSDYYIGTGSSGGGGGAIYAKLRVPKGLSIKIFDIGAGGTPGKYRFEGCGSSWNTGGDGGHGGNTVVTIGGNDILRIDGGGAHGGGTEVGGQNSNGGGSGGCVAIRNNSSEITLIDNVFSCGYRGDNGADWQITNAAGGNSGQIPGGKGIRTEVFGGGSGAKRIENSNEVVAAGIGGGGHGGYWDWGAAAGGRGEAIVYITYLWNVTFNSNGGSPNPSSISEIYNGRKIGEPSKPAKTGYIFDGWYKNAECTDANRWDFNNSGVTGDMTLYAKWTKEEYYITYDLNGGINHASNPLIYNVETPTITLQSPTREHFTFGGWFDNAELSGTTVTLIPNGSTWNKTYYAKWVAIPFTVSFDTKGGSPTPPQVIVNSGNLVDKPNDPTRLHHEFLGWFIDLDSDIQWSFVNNTVTKDITLNAKWHDINSGNRIRLSGDKTYIYDNTEKSLQTIELFLESSKEWIVLQEDTDFTAKYGNNTNSGLASATITGKGDFVAQIASMPDERKILTFTIQKRPVTVTWENTILTYNGSLQSPTPISSDSKFPVTVKPETKNTDNGRYNAEAVTSNTNITLTGNTTTYVINPKSIKVIWGNKRDFVFNKMIQHPTWSLESDEIDKNHVFIAPTYAVVGEYTVANNLAPVVQIVPEHNSNIYHNNYTLVDTRVDYEIVKKPLNVALKKNGEFADEIEVARSGIDSVSNVINALKAIIDYKGFATDTINKTSDDKGVLTGEPVFEITTRESGQASRSVRDGGAISVSELLQNGEYNVAVKVSDIVAQNYKPEDGQIVLKVSDLFVTFTTETREGPIAIAKPQKSDRKYGILLEKAVVSDVAKISVKTPEQAQVTLIVYDNVGNVVFESKNRNNKEILWDLTNSAGRNVANGAYLIIAEARGNNAKTYKYSAKLGVKR